MLSEKLGGRFAIGQFKFMKLETRGSLELMEPVAFQFDAVICVEVIDSNHLMPAIEQGLREVKTDKASRASDKMKFISDYCRDNGEYSIRWACGPIVGPNSNFDTSDFNYQ